MGIFDARNEGMRRLVWLLSLLLVLGLASWAGAQSAAAPTGSGSAAELAPMAGDETETTTVNVPSTSVADLVHALSKRLGESGSVPEWGRVAVAKAERPRLSAADMFMLLTKAAQSWQTDHRLPDSIPLAIGGIDPPILDPQDYPTPTVDQEKGRNVNADQVLAFAGETLRWMEQSGSVPTAVWIGGERLSAAEYLAALVICLDYAFSSEGMGKTLFLPDYSPPLSWAQHTDLIAASGPHGTPNATPPAMTPPLQDVAASAPPAPSRPEVTLLPAPGAVHGVVDLVVNYSGPSVNFLTFTIDGRSRAVMNSRPYGYRWNTEEISPGKHQVLVRVFGESDVEITSTSATYVVRVPKPQKAPVPPKPKS